MKIKVSFILIVFLLALSLTTTASAMGVDPAGGCPDGFVLQYGMDHDGHADHMHKHAGNDDDQNGDGYLCMKPVGLDGKIHVHIDNNVPQN